LATKDHFSSNCTSRVRGGKSHEFVVELLGVVAGHQGVAADGVLADADQPTGLADADAFGEVSEEGGGLVGAEPGVKQGSALALGEAGFTAAAVKEAALVWAVAGADGKVAAVALAVGGAVGVEAAEAAEVVQSEIPGARTGDNSYQVRGTRPENDSTLQGHDLVFGDGVETPDAPGH
jgi:hypothetical protein